MPTYYKLNEDKTVSPCSAEEWSKQLEELHKNGNKHVALDVVDGKIVSTIWLGTNHNWLESPPLIFETMIFDEWEIGNGREIYCERYSTYKEAEEGHKTAIQWVVDGCKERP